MLCSYGCGKESTKIFKNGKLCCSERSDQCNAVIAKRIATRKAKGPWHSEQAKENIGNSSRGRILTEDWKKKIGSSLVGRVVGDDTREKLREGKLADKNPMFGEKPWNAGLTADTDNRVSDYSLKQKDIPCPARSHPNKNKGIRKQESLEIISRNDPVYSNFRKYRNRVAVRTRKTYEQFKEEINPSNFTLGKCGIDGAYQIDHITTVRIGFEQGIAVEEISSKENLQIIPWLDNIKKYDGKGNRKC
jgi:hypothetical protein